MLGSVRLMMYRLVDCGQGNKEEGQTKEDPRSREDVDGGFEPEQGVPDGGCSEEDSTNDLQLNIRRCVGICCVGHLAEGDNDGVPGHPPSSRDMAI